MKVLIVGSGGREHALTWKISQSDKVSKIFVAPGNAGTAEIAENVQIEDNANLDLMRFAKDNDIDLTVVGPEVPLANGIVDLFLDNDLRIFGPKKSGAKIEASKKYSKDIMRKYDIPTATYRTFTEIEAAKEFVAQLEYPQVIKADGLAAGKGVLIVKSKEEALSAIDCIMKENIFGKAGAEIVIEEFLEGQEISLLAFADGNTIVPMTTSQDHKKVFDGEKGPNTGGMGAYSPANIMSDEELENAVETVLKRMLEAFKSEGIDYKGVLYAGLMLTEKGLRVLEFNCRFGDPETQVLLPRLDTDLIDIMNACIDGKLNDIEINWSNNHAVCVVLASDGYPGTYEKGFDITGINNCELVFHAGTKREGEKVISNGGRVLGVMAVKDTLEEAIKSVYKDVDKINYKGKYYRKDIARTN